MKGKKCEYGFALSGGGARGFAHLGAIKALKENGIEPGAISGTSAGAIAAAFIADGYTPDEALEIFMDQKLYRIIGLSLPKKGLGSISGMEKLLKKNIRTKRIEDFNIPAYFTATDLNNGKAVHFSEGEVIPRVIASASIPILFQPVKIDGISYVDGGVMDMLPTEPLLEQCEKIVGIDTNPGGYREEFENIISIGERVFYLSFSHKSKEKVKDIDIHVQPGVSTYSWFDLGRSKKIFESGYEAAQKALKKIDNEG